MVLRMRNRSRIDNPREYAPAVVDDLRNVLLTGGDARHDPQRQNFYELEGDRNSTYYISPINGTVTLLAKWLREHQNSRVEEISVGA